MLPQNVNTLLQLLDSGKISSLCDSCCPCSDYYVFSNVDKYIEFISGMNWDTASTACTQGNPTSYQTSCCTEDCFEQLSSYLGTDSINILLDKGFVEYSLLGNRSMLCVLYDYIIQNNLTPADGLDFIDEVLEKGIVFYCKKDTNLSNGDDSEQVFASVETFLEYANGIGLTACYDPLDPLSDPCKCFPQETCCFSINSSVETYLKYAEAVGLTNSGGGAGIP